ncbi:MAG: hypothetical protein ACYDD4_11145 [Acidimicrobiales bacterium]
MTVEPMEPYDPLNPLVPVTPQDAFARGPAVHSRILELSRELPTVANKGDHARLSADASTLLETFVRHAEDERHLVLRLPPLTARLIERGQQRVVDRLVHLVLQADLAEEPCRCSELAEELASLIEVQIISEEWDQSDR